MGLTPAQQVEVERKQTRKLLTAAQGEIMELRAQIAKLEFPKPIKFSEQRPEDGQHCWYWVVGRCGVGWDLGMWVESSFPKHSHFGGGYEEWWWTPNEEVYWIPARVPPDLEE